MLAAMAIFCVSMNAQEPQKKECCKKEKRSEEHTSELQSQR